MVKRSTLEENIRFYRLRYNMHPQQYRDLTIARKNEICKRYLSMFRRAVNTTNRTNSDLMEELHLLLYYYNDWYNDDGTFHKENDDEIIG